ncbi:MAG: hypothetical protein U5J98_03810 [Halobacteriales archaeon]|nr:hypothetical protein [Halobacteriales archaeon]
MERLEACYFCGTAEDAPLREVTVTPRSRQGDPDAAVTLTLCRSCEGKLERVLGGIFEHVESRSAAGRTADEPGESTVAAENEPDDEAPEPGPIDRIDVSSGGTDDEPRGRRDLFDDPPDTSALDDVGGDAPDEPEADEAEIVEEEPVTARATMNSSTSLEGVSVSEYNKVMRLLQNREFPMARDAFVDLGASAYDLGEGTVEAVLDAVIGQGALAERDGELVRPGEEGSP